MIVYTKEMPWMETHMSDERARFVRNFESGHWSITELCERYGVSRPTGYKWIARLGSRGVRRPQPRHASVSSPDER